jgi:hypothetical protein
MKEVVLAESLTNKTISRSRLSFDGTSVGGLVLGAATSIPGIVTLIADPGGNLLAGAACFAAGTMLWFVGATNSGAVGEIYKFHQETMKEKDLKAKILSGTRMKIGKSRYSSKKEINADYFSTKPNYEKYEIELFVRNTKGKLTVEYEISEIPTYTWETAFKSVLINDNIRKDDLELFYQHEHQDEARQEADRIKKSYRENSKGFLSSEPAI